MPHDSRVVDSLTVLTCAAGCVAGKIWHAGEDKPRGHNAGWRFTVEERRFESFNGLAEILAEIEQDNTKLVIRGDPTKDFGGDWVRATKYRPELEGTERKNGHFGPKARQWVMIDLDKLPLPPGADVFNDPDAVVRWAITASLPSEFHVASCFWQFSTSTHPALEGFVSIHAWFCLDRAADWGDLEAWLIEYGNVDVVSFRDVQKHYCARPTFEGWDDPLPRRSGLLRGTRDAVEVPKLPSRDRDDPIKKRRSSSLRTPAGGIYSESERATLKTARGWDGKIALIGDGAGQCGFRQPLVAAYASAVLGMRRADIAEESLIAKGIAAVTHVIKYGTVKPGRTDRGKEYLEPALHRTLIESAMEKFCLAELSEPTYSPPKGTLEEARRITRQGIAAHFDRGVEHQRTQAFTNEFLGDESHMLAPPLTIGQVGTGIGKSREAILEAVRRDAKIVFAVDRHKLGDELAGRFPEVSTRVWRGRAADDPLNPGAAMCTQPDRVQLALSAGLAVESTVCSFKDKQCPDYGVCGYQRQKKDEGQIIFCAHEVLFGAKPDSFGDDLDAVVIDEDFIDAALGPMVRVDPKGGALEYALEMIATKGDGWLARDIALEAGSNVDWYKATSEEWRRANPPEVHPGMSVQVMKATIRAHNSSQLQVIRRARLYADLGLLTRMHGPETSGRIFVKEGKHGRAIHHMPLIPIAKGFRLPTLALSATARPRLIDEAVGDFFPTPTIFRANAASPFVHVHQCVDQAFAQTRLIPEDIPEEKITPEQQIENNRRAKRAREVWRYVRLVAEGETLVICQQGIEQMFRDWGLPDNIATAHFNDIAGLDRFKDVETLIVIGRTLPPDHEASFQAGHLSGAHVPVPPDGYFKAPRGIALANGVVVTVENPTHPDALAEEVRASVCEDELVQALGRARGVNRTASNPLTVHLLTNVVLPIAVDSTFKWSEECPDLIDEMLVDGGLLKTAEHVSRAWPYCWPSGEAFRKYRSRLNRTFPYKEHTNRGLSGLRNFEQALQNGAVAGHYQLDERHARARWHPFFVCHDNPQEWLQQRLGPLKAIQIDEAQKADES